MFSIEIECDPEKRDFLIAELWDRGCEGIVEIAPHRVRAFFDDSDRKTLTGIYPDAQVRIEPDRNWIQEARDLMQPMAVGARFFLVPEWRDDPAPEGRFRITVNPGMAFGTGVHETTRLCLEVLEDYLKPGMTVADIGTGSGILAKSARLLGAARVIACDTDPIAVEIAGEGFVGSVDALATASVDLVTANISPEAIVRLAGDLIRVLRPGGVLLASGFELHEVQEVKAALPDTKEVREKGNWALVVFVA